MDKKDREIILPKGIIERILSAVLTLCMGSTMAAVLFGISTLKSEGIAWSLGRVDK